MEIKSFCDLTNLGSKYATGEEPNNLGLLNRIIRRILSSTLEQSKQLMNCNTSQKVLATS
jgi:hypothetical protein